MQNIYELRRRTHALYSPNYTIIAESKDAAVHKLCRMEGGIASDFYVATEKPNYRCDHCGRIRSDSLPPFTQCAPPFQVQPHSFTGAHPADRREMGLD